MTQYAQTIKRKALKRRFGISKQLMKQFFPKPGKDTSQEERKTVPAETVEAVMQDPEFQEAYLSDLLNLENGEELLQLRHMIEHASSLEALIDNAPSGRRFILHVGPTNSGKTYQALQALKQASCGVYLGPLRLLALEIFDTLNQTGTICSLLTGEEEETLPFSTVTSSTIEMCSYETHYDVAVVDECQLIANEDRGANWTRAIFCLQADEIHLCLAPEALPLITSLLEQIHAPYEVQQCHRLTPLTFSGVLSELSQAQPGDAFIAFSRRKVLAIAAELEEAGIQTSVIYGGLPPAARREEIRRFHSGESCVVVATDAIGMGVSLPIRRVIFCETEKRDEVSRRPLTTSEIKQIAGRAGRYGKYEEGLVLSMVNPALIQEALEQETPLITRIVLPFPSAIISEDMDISACLEQWESLFLSPHFRRTRMDTALYLAGILKELPVQFSNDQFFRLITCPFDINDHRLVLYWRDCCLAISRGEPLPHPNFPLTELYHYESCYAAHEIRFRLIQSFGGTDDYCQERRALCLQINSLLAGSKAPYFSRCRICGKRLPITYRETICPDCQKEQLINAIVASSGNSGGSTLGSMASIKHWK